MGIYSAFGPADVCVERAQDCIAVWRVARRERAETLAAVRCRVWMPARDVRWRQRINPRTGERECVGGEGGWGRAMSSKRCPRFVAKTNVAPGNQNRRASD